VYIFAGVHAVLINELILLRVRRRVAVAASATAITLVVATDGPNITD
jgi:hypothetical protein